METTKLKAVSIEKIDTCLTYAFKRIGHEIKIYDVAELEHHYDLLDYFEYSNRLEVGDILIFTHGQENVVVGTHITEDGKILFHNVITHRHCVVYEGNGLVSDLSRTGIKGLVLPSLRMRYLKEIKIRPTYLLRLPQN
jgi:hypothetical protein